MIIRVGLLSALVATGIPAAHVETQPAASELSFTVHVQSDAGKAAICVAPTPELDPARRMTRVAQESTGDWSPDGQALAVADGDPPKGGIRIVHADGSGSGIATRPRPNELDSAPTWSPDGTRIAFARYVFFARGVDYGRMGVWVAVPRSRQERQISTHFAGSLDWSPSGDLIAADIGGESSTDVLLLRAGGGLERTIHVGRRAPFGDGVTWSPDGRRLALGDGLVIDLSGNDAGRYAPVSSSDFVIRSPAWSPDGDSVAYVRARNRIDARTNIRVLGNGDLYLGPIGGRAPVRLTATPRISEAAPAWRASASGGAGKRQQCVLTGTARRDLIRGTRLDDLIDAGAGDDVVNGAGGNDFAAGGAGSDVLVGGPGRDWLWGEAGKDRFRTRDRNRDSIIGGLGDDRAWIDRRLDAVLGVEHVSFAR